MDSSDTFTTISDIWVFLETKGKNDGLTNGRIYRRLDIENESGLRACCCFPERNFELLIQLTSPETFDDASLPLWGGMKFVLIELNLPVENTFHLSLRLENREHLEVFTSLCSDLADDLNEVKPEKRDAALKLFLERWTRFFERHSTKGLSPEKRRGLFGELYWLRNLIENGNIGAIKALKSWKGCEKGYHDFDLKGHVIEVKTTMTKEPRRVMINNERQLDDTGLTELHLLVLTLHTSESGGESLPALIGSLLFKYADSPMSQRRFKQCLNESGYLEIHASLYPESYIVTKEELFMVRDNFPRITVLPNGIGDIKYSLTVSAINNFIVNIEEYLKQLNN